MTIKTLIFGSSLCNKLESFDRKKNHTIKGKKFVFRYRGFSGESFENFIDQPNRIDNILIEDVPDVIVVIFGGNSISTLIEPPIVYRWAKDFYALLKARLNIFNPSAVIVASEICMRYVYNGFKDTPLPDRFDKIRHQVNLKIRDSPNKDYLFRVEGQGRLDHRRNYDKYGVHLSETGLDLRLTLLLSTLEFMVNNPK